MENIVDIVRMQVLSNVGDKGKSHWKYMILLAVLGNYKKLFQQLMTLLTDFFKLPYFQRFLNFSEKKFIDNVVKEDARQPKATVNLSFAPRGDLDNKILKEIINRHAIEFDAVQLKNPNVYHVVQPKTIPLSESIFFRLEFANAAASNNAGNNNATQGPSVATNPSVELQDSKGKVFSYDKSLKEILDFLHENYVPSEPKHVAPKPTATPTKKITLHKMTVAKVTNFDFKTDEMKGDLIEFTVSKSLDNLFLEADVKELLISQISRFNDPNWYAERGLPRTLGILLYGEPGCGKTSFIKSLCSHMKRRALIIDFKLVRTATHLRKIFSETFTENKEHGDSHRFTKDTTVYVFEDFDCMSDIFLDRKLKDAQREQDGDTKHQQEEFDRDMLKLKQLETIERLKLKSKKKKKRSKRNEPEETNDSKELKREDKWEEDSDSDNGRLRLDEDDKELEYCYISCNNS